MALIKHSKRTIRTGCPNCGDKESDFYWAHDTDQPFAHDCKECDTNGKYVLIDRDGARHVCGDTPPEQEQAPTTTTTAQQETTPDPAEMLTKALRGVLGTPTIDRAEVERIAREVVSGVVYPTRTFVVKDEIKLEVEGNTHVKLLDVAQMLQAGEHVLMVGPAGTGKSTLAEQAAGMLGIESYSLSLSPQTPVSQILGYQDANGNYVRSLFREAYEHGGLFHFDEMDNSNPSTLAVVNAALANGHMAFPDGMVKRSGDFRCVASANTYGRGATREYVGRQAIDAATLDRFSIITIEIDTALEKALCYATGVDAAKADKVLRVVERMRTNSEKAAVKVVISPRASVGMCRLLAAGMSWDEASNARLRRGMDDATWEKVKP